MLQCEIINSSQDGSKRWCRQDQSLHEIVPSVEKPQTETVLPTLPDSWNEVRRNWDQSHLTKQPDMD